MRLFSHKAGAPRGAGGRLTAPLLFALAFIICLPVLLTLPASLKSTRELADSLAPVLQDTGEPFSWTLLPRYPTGMHYVRLLFLTPDFFTVFWNSVKIVGLILVGQLLVAVPAAWFFATARFRGRGLLFTLYVMLMLLPFQVTMLPSYLVLNRLQLLNTHGAVIWPAVFATFPVFLIYRGFTAIPGELFEAARVDGAGEFTVFWRIGVPLGSPGIFSALILSFLDYWNMMEQPMAFLQDKRLWPLSLYLPEIRPEQAGMALSAAVITLVPAFFIFLIGQDYLEQGIVASGLKG